MAKNITPRKENFPQWYQDVIKVGKLATHAPVKGCMIIQPNGYSIWESLQNYLDTKFKETGHRNAYFPLLIPESFITKEAEHVEGFAPELAMVTYAGGKELEEKYVIRPSSETIIGYAYAQWIQSYRDLPMLMNQWCSVMRWEKRTRLFLRTSEFLWQEGHTAHANAQEAQEETEKMLGIYKDFLENVCAIPVIDGAKPEHEKFPGADTTYTVEALMQDKKALQMGTSHNLGQNFSKAFGIQFSDQNNELQYAYTTSWGVSTRILGGLIMTHGDDDGIIIPPRLAPRPVVVIPIVKSEEQKEQILAYADNVVSVLKKQLGSLKVELDTQFHLSPGDRFFTWIQQGTPLRIEIGIKDIEKNIVVAVRRDTRKKDFIPIDELGTQIPDLLEDIQNALFEKARTFQEENTFYAENYEQFKEYIKQGGFVYAYWDGSSAVANQIQDETKATIRCLPVAQETKEGACVVSGKPTKIKALFAVAY